MPIGHVHSFLVHPAKREEEQPDISGTQIPRHGPLYTMLTHVFDRAHEECDIDIVFKANDEGQQQNDCRDLLVAYAQEPTIPTDAWWLAACRWLPLIDQGSACCF